MSVTSSWAIGQTSDEVISVVVRAQKEIEEFQDNRNPTSLKKKFTMYTVIVKNNRTEEKVIVKRRYSEFYKLRQDLLELVSWKHCAYCDSYSEEIAAYPFPRRRLLRSSQKAIVKERMDSLGLFLRHLLRCLLFKSFADCPQTCAQMEHMILQTFLQVDQNSQFLIAQTNINQQIPKEFIQAIESKRQQQKVLAADLRSRTLLENNPRDIYEEDSNTDTKKLALSASQVGMNNCTKCYQKWINCYCNNEDDENIYANMTASTKRRHKRKEDNSHRRYDDRNERSVDPKYEDYYESLYSSEHTSAAGSETSRCSRCEKGWNNCYCCQQNSPSTSSASVSTLND